MNYNEWLDIDVLEDYLDGKLDAKAMYQVEKISLEDPFVAEALAGLSQSPKRSQSLSLLQKQLQERIAQKPVEQKRWTITSHRLSIAAAAAVLFVTVSVLFWMKESSRQKFEATQAKNIETEIAPKKVTPTPQAVPSTNADVVIDKAIEAAKTNTYAGVKQSKATRKSTASAPVAKSSVLSENNEEQLSNVMVAKESRVNNMEPSTILKAKVAGLQITPTDSDKAIKGIVYAKEDGKPLAGVAVKINGSNIATITNPMGEFSLPADSLSKQAKLSLSYIGFNSKEVVVNAQNAVKIEMEQDSHSLSEVVISDVIAKKKNQVVASAASITLDSESVLGRAKFEEYLTLNNKLIKNKTASGKTVRLSFTIKRNNRPTDIKIVNGLTKEENDEAIRLLKDGPDWKFNKNTSKVVFVNINF